MSIGEPGRLQWDAVRARTRPTVLGDSSTVLGDMLELVEWY